jgi:hypothetical protein
MQTFELRILTDSQTNVDDLVQYMLGNRVTKPTIFGAVEVDEANIPNAPIPVKRGVKWDGSPVEQPGVTYSMSTPNDGPTKSKTRQTVTVYEHRDGVTSVVTRMDNAVTINGEPMPTSLTAPDRRKVYATQGNWTPIEGLWVCLARVESV